MLMIRKKQEPIHAFQMTREVRSKVHEWPQWLQCALEKETGSLGSMCTDGHPYTNCSEEHDDKYVVCNATGCQVVDWDNWIFMRNERDLYVMTDEACKDLYEPHKETEE